MDLKEDKLELVVRYNALATYRNDVADETNVKTSDKMMSQMVKSLPDVDQSFFKDI